MLSRIFVEKSGNENSKLVKNSLPNIILKTSRNSHNILKYVFCLMRLQLAIMYWEHPRSFLSYSFVFQVINEKQCVAKILLVLKFSRSWWSGKEKHFFFLFMPSHALLQRHAELKRFLYLYKEFSYMQGIEN